MLPQTSIHVHTSYCDGKSTPAELVREALHLGLKTLGFSGHSPSDFADTSGMSAEGLSQYIAEISQLKAQFTGQLEIILGIEQDYFSPINRSSFDYIIGSVHSIKSIHNGKRYVMDGSTEKLNACADEAFNKDGLAMALAYYDTYKAMIHSLKPDIAGHLDLLTKSNRGLFDENSPIYQKAALEAAECAWQAGAVIEINTGGMARGYTQKPYPAPFILKQLALWRAPVTITSDCHKKETLCYAFPEAVKLARACGITELHEWREGGFKPEPL